MTAYTVPANAKFVIQPEPVVVVTDPTILLTAVPEPLTSHPFTDHGGAPAIMVIPTEGGGGTPPPDPVPTTGQIWPRGR